MHKVTKVRAAALILDEIDSEYNPQDQFSTSAAPFETESFQADVSVTDARAANLKNFFRKHGSPLYDHAEFIVKTADKYEFDYRLLPAIAMKESGLCRAIPKNSHNCWGWGIYGNTVTSFDSYDEAIDTVSRGIKKNYIDQGLVTATEIMSKYTPASDGSWARGVNSVMQLLE